MQENNGVQLLSTNSDQLEIDTTGMSPCILTTAPSDCTNGGATYMFWIKLLNEEGSAILTTLDYNSPTEGMRIEASNDGKYCAAVFRKGPEPNFLNACNAGIGNMIGSWMHVTTVWHTDPKFEVFLDGDSKPMSQPDNYGSSLPMVSEAQMRMKLGLLFLTHGSGVKTRSMIIDNLMLFDRPLTQSDISLIIEHD